MGKKWNRADFDRMNERACLNSIYWKTFLYDAVMAALMCRMRTRSMMEKESPCRN